ncbi:hypothetical protein E3U23_03535 [Erythrobacter litoralis]|uniref:SH3 domain-containing protein n=1 Tax=Erythrobacter litoralis TaxID=39960 RepID=UPI0024350DDB|nr:SH3 domain-containing protein [Erythrobacter litoralis]MDG6078260.1 hypothetical protein [Erythrobacter litoralis]
MKSLRFSLAMLAISLSFSSLQAQDREVPYWATVRATELNMRVGPSAEYRVAWVYRRAGLPVKVLRTMEGWRLIEDSDGDKGWVVARLLSPDRGAIVVGDGLADMRADSSDTAELKWRVEPGVSGALGKCEDGWCAVEIDGRRGWIEENRLWGDGAP